eukprot:TRINITY_DN613_c0_g3_i1.p2 TRINITY_DN613_c0_g3~~TRINITY_DN613_c0_g3_i1.p2  ORF type:complete len:229 (+),score=108.12 TRINITY_DN613_c0_g3_i1:43-729(+)
MMFRLLTVAAAAVACTYAKDPVGGWLGFATGVNPTGAGRITRAEAKWKVLDKPKEGGCFYSPWFGIETSDNRNLFQPVNPWEGSRWGAYVEYFQWLPTHNENSEEISGTVSPGDVLHGVVTFDESAQTYTAVHTNLNTQHSVTKTIGVQKEGFGGAYKNYTIMYIVFEKSCRSCAQYPPNDKVTFYDIELEYEGKQVNPTWNTSYVDNTCNNRAHIVNSSTVEITWES